MIRYNHKEHKEGENITKEEIGGKIYTSIRLPDRNVMLEAPKGHWMLYGHYIIFLDSIKSLINEEDTTLNDVKDYINLLMDFEKSDCTK